MLVASWAATDTGRKRDHNEDSFLIDKELGLYAVADGMGGHQGGECASKMALDIVQQEVRGVDGDFEAGASKLVDAFRYEEHADSEISAEEIVSGDEDTLDEDVAEKIGGGDVVVRSSGPGRGGLTEEESGTTSQIGPPLEPAQVVLTAAARNAGRAIYDRAQEEPKLHGMGTTLTALLFNGPEVLYAHAGDSRAYLFRDGALNQVTEDHSWIWEQIKSGVMTEEEAKESKFRHIITRSVGFERDVMVDCGTIDLRAGDCFLLCSDGVTNYVENSELEGILKNNWLRRVPQLLVDLANNRGGDDNITVVVVYAGNHADAP